MIENLCNLTRLDRKLLHVFVGGPGIGEGIAIALPGRGWILIDGCRTRAGETSLLKLVQKLREDPEADRVEWMILSHPHEDHADGFAETLNALKPRKVGATGRTPAPTLRDEVEAWIDESGSTLDEIRRNQVLSAFRAIRAWEEGEGGKQLTGLHRGMRFKVGDVEIEVLAPDPDAMEHLLSEGWKKLRSKANSISLVLRLCFGETLILFGGDLPTSPDRKTGWRTLAAADGDLWATTALKVPHHGSEAALHAKLLERARQDATWWLTPYGPQCLPRAEGLAKLLKHKPTVQLTSFPSAQARRAAPACFPLLTERDYAAAISPASSSRLLRGAKPITPVEVAVLDPFWGVSFDDQDQILGQWRGQAAFTVSRTK